MNMKKLCLVLTCCLFATASLTHAEGSQFEYRKGLAISLGIGVHGTDALNWDFKENMELNDVPHLSIGPIIFPPVPSLSLALGYGVDERQLYYIESDIRIPGGGMGLGYRYFPANYDKVYIFGRIGTFIFPIPTDDDDNKYSESLPLFGIPSVRIRGGIGYQWARYSSIELALSYDRYWRGSTRRSWDFSTPFVHHIGISIELHGILW